MAPKASTIGMLVNPTNPDAEIEARDAQAAAQELGRKLLVVKASTENDIEAAFATLAEQGAGALAVAGDPFFLARAVIRLLPWRPAIECQRFTFSANTRRLAV